MKTDQDSLSRLMALAQGGDADAYRAVLTGSQAWLQRFFAGRINPALVDDVVQETLVSVHAKRATYDPVRPYLPWLAAIARYRWVDQLRRTYRAKEAELDDAMATSDDDGALTARVSLDKLLAHLSAGQRDVIRLVKIEGQTIKEASDRTGQSEPLVKINIHRGLKRLSTIIEQGE